MLAVQKERGCGVVSTHHLSLLERLEVLVLMASVALSCGAVMLVSVHEGKSRRAWIWAGLFAATSLAAAWGFWRLA